MKSLPIGHILISLLFMVFLSTPMLVSLVSEDKSISRSEKRKLAPLPEIKFSKSMFEDFPKQFEKYVEDHFGFRSQIVRKHNYTLCRIFKVSPSSMVTIGSNNWYFFNGDAAIDDYLGRIRFNNFQLEKMSRLLGDRDFWLNSLGTKYIFLPIPNKEPVYEEYLPVKLRENRGKSKYEQIVEYISQNSSFKGYIDVQKIMYEHKQDAQLYLRTDSHWNHDGAYIVYREMIDKVREWFPDVTPSAQKQEKQWVQNFSGDLAILMNLRGLVTETVPDLNIVQTCDTKKNKRMNYLKELDEYKNLPHSRLPVTGGCEKRKYKVLFIHDSFGRFLAPYLTELFETVIFVNYMNFEKAKVLIELEQPDIVIDQRVGRNIEKALLQDPELEQIVLQDKFDKLSLTHTWIEGTKWKDFVTTKPAENIEYEGDSIKARFSDNSSLTIALDYPAGPVDPGVVRLDITSANETELSLCYTAKNDDIRGSKQCTTRNLKKGRNELFFRIIEPDLTGSLVISPQSRGTYKIHKLILKRENF